MKIKKTQFFIFQSDKQVKKKPHEFMSILLASIAEIATNIR